MKDAKKNTTVRVVVPVKVAKGSTLKDYVGQSIEEVREGFRLRRNQSLDQAVDTGEIKLFSGRAVFAEPPSKEAK